MNFKVGDIVQLKSGGPAMTVSSISTGSGSVICHWFNAAPGGWTLAQATFAPDELKAASES